MKQRRSNPSAAIGFPKGRPRRLDKDAAKAERAQFDQAQSAEAKRRAGGRCEIFVVGQGRCEKRDLHTHHMISGIGRRALGVSAKAIHKQRVCADCHRLITGHVLKVLSEGRLPVFSDPYEDFS